MGMFDTVRCEYPLPDERHQHLEFQTKSLERALDDYTITADGRLLRRAGRTGLGPQRDIEWPLHGDISIYSSYGADSSDEDGWVEYVVRFTDGRVESIRPAGEAEQAPEVASAGAESTEEASDAETALLQSLRRARPDLEKLLDECRGHWGYEDPIYRFYHQSFKVYGLQRSTQLIVQRLQALAPERPFHPWFVEIVRSGTEKEFTPEDNARWTEVTRPIVEAFFHAQYFLEMAVRYGNLEAPPRPLPSGYAALLYLFGLR